MSCWDYTCHCQGEKLKQNTFFSVAFGVNISSWSNKFQVKIKKNVFEYNLCNANTIDLQTLQQSKWPHQYPSQLKATKLYQIHYKLN